MKIFRKIIALIMLLICLSSMLCVSSGTFDNGQDLNVVFGNGNLIYRV